MELRSTSQKAEVPRQTERKKQIAGRLRKLLVRRRGGKETDGPLAGFLNSMPAVEPANEALPVIDETRCN